MGGPAQHSVPALNGGGECTAAPTHPALVGARVRFPPRWETVSLATSPLSAARQGITLYSASRPGPLLAQRAVWALSFVGGSLVIPGERRTWVPPMGVDRFARLWDVWTSLIGAPIAGFAAYERAQPTRSGTALMLCAGRGSLFVRVQEDGDDLDLERRVSDTAQRGQRSFRVPVVRGAGCLDGWHWLASEVLSTRPHSPLRPSDRSLRALEGEISDLVEATIERPAGTPAHWRGAHGDLTPWNLRRAGSETFLIDWEDAGYAPPGADRVYFDAARAALRSRRAHRKAHDDDDEARRYWYEIVSNRPPVQVEGSLRGQLLAHLSPRSGEPQS